MLKRENIIGVVLIVGAAAAVLILGSMAPPGGGGDSVQRDASPDHEARIATKAAQYPLAREIVAPGGFLNTEGDMPITIQQYVGEKVILLDIWTYSCINCQRTLPYLRAWHETYAADGLLILGVHTPEFEFEKDIENVRSAAAEFGVTWPIVLDNQRGTWNAYGNRYWPRKYLIDIDGFVVYDHIGEGAYEETERKIREALAERSDVLGEETAFSGYADPNDVEVVDVTRPRTPEIYLGAWRNVALGNGTQRTEGSFSFGVPAEVQGDTLYLGGAWDIAYEYAASTSEGSRIVMPYQATKLFMVLAPAGEPVKARVLLDGKPILEEDAGADVIFGDGDPYILVDEDRMYRIVEPIEGWGQHLFELVPEGPGLEAYTFTFG